MTMFYFVSAKSSSSWVWLGTDPLPTGCRYANDSTPFELDVKVARGDLSDLTGPPSFTVSNRGKVGDLLWTEGMPYKVVSQRLLEVLEEMEATGWTSTPVEVRYKNGDDLPGFHLLSITGNCDDIHATYDPTTIEEDFEVRYARGLDVSEGWDGSDLFWSRDAAGIDFLATERVVKEFNAAGLTGLEFEDSRQRRILLD